MAPIVRRMRLVRSDGSTVDGLTLSGQQAPKQASTPQPIPKVASMMPSGSSGSGSATTVKEAIALVAAMAAKKAVDAAAAK
jgi:hypothetical protein